ncbi:hypothetical protein [Streptacidiphilus sp. PAMC 29251]
MRLYTRTGATALDHPVHGHFEADGDAFNFPDELSDELYGFAHQGKPDWETDVERQTRLIAEATERAKDPATLLEAMLQIQQLLGAALVKPTEPQPASESAATPETADDDEEQPEGDSEPNAESDAETTAKPAAKRAYKRTAAKPAADA